MQRVNEIEFGAARVVLPSFYPSVSSVKTNLLPADYVQLLTDLQFPQFLLSAYDYQHATEQDRHRIDEYLARARGNGTTILLDSGNYESYWLRDSEWTADLFQHFFC